MSLTKDGFYKSFSGAIGNTNYLLEAGGGHIGWGNAASQIPYSNGTVNSNLNADMVDGLHVHGGRNNEANKIVRTDGSGYIQAGWINTTSGDIGSTSFSRIYVSNDAYIRYVSVAQFKTGLFGGQVGSPSVPIYWTGSAFATCIVSFGNQSYGEHNANNINDNGIKYYNSNGPSTSLGATTSNGALYSQAYSTSWVAQIAQDYRNGGLYVRGKNNGTWQSWYRVWDNRTTYVSGGKGYIGSTEITQVNNSDTVDGHHQDHLLPYRYTYGQQTNSGSTDWYVRIQTASYISEDCTIYVRGTGNNTSSDLVIHVLCRENRFWGWETSYNGVRINGIAKETGAPEIIYLRMPSSTTSITFKSTHSLTIDKADYSSKSYMSLGEGLFANYIYGRIQNADYSDTLSNPGKYYWANISLQTSSSTSTSPTFSTAYTSNWFRSTGATGWYSESYGGGIRMTDSSWIRTYGSKNFYVEGGNFAVSGNAAIGTTSFNYRLYINGDSYATGWSRAGSGFYCENTGVHFTHQGSVGEIDMTSNNEFLWGASGSTLYFNYRGVSRGTTVTNYIWNAGSSSTYAGHTQGWLNLFPGSRSNYGEGIRLHSASNGWTTLILCGTDLTGDSGTSTNSWSMHTYGGNFYLNKNNSSTATVNRLWARTGGGFTFGNTTNTSYVIESAGDVRTATGWFRSTGAYGWYSESYGGGIYMTDSTYVRVYNSKAFYVANSTYYAMNTAGGFYGKMFSLNNDHYILKPWGAMYITSSDTHTGAITITLPANIGNSMISMWIDVYNYSTNTSFSVHVGGYTYSNSTWQHNPFAMVYGENHTVRLGHNGTSFIIYIGETNSIWHYPQVSVRDVVLGFNSSFSNWVNQWTIGFSTSFSNVTATITNYVYTTKNAAIPNKGTANRIAWYNGASSITSAANIWTNGTKLGINTTSEPSYNFYVSGTSYHTGTLYVAGQPAIQTAAGVGNWNYIRMHNGSNYWDIATKSNSNSGALDFRPGGADNIGPRIDTNGRVQVSNVSNSTTNYDGSAMWIREYHYGGSQSDSWGNAPRLGWHWSGRVAAQIGLASNGWLYEAPNTGTSFYRIVLERSDIKWGINVDLLDGYHAGNGSGQIPISNGTVCSNLNADMVDSQHFTYSNSSNSPTYLWGTNSSGTNFLARRDGLSVNYANSAGTVNLVVNSNITTAGANWYRIASYATTSDMCRGLVRFSLITTGGSWSPYVQIIEVDGTWSHGGVASFRIIGPGYVTKVRTTYDSANVYIEIYTSSALSATLRVIKNNVNYGNVNESWSWKTGALVAGGGTQVSIFEPGSKGLSISNLIFSSGFVKSGSNDNYCLTGGGSHKQWTTNNTANALVSRDGSGDTYVRYSFATYFNSSAGDENPTIGSIYIRNTSDNYIRRMSRANFGAQMRDSGTMDGRWVLKSGDSMSGTLTISVSGTTALSTSCQGVSKTSPTTQNIVINGPNYNANDTMTLKHWPGIGFHMPGRTWGSLIWNGYFTGINASFDGYVGFYGSGFWKHGSSNSYLLRGAGDHIAWGNAANQIPYSNGTLNTNLNADMTDGLHVHGGRNNEANKIVRTDGNGYIQAGWINTTSGDMGTTAIDRVYCSNDGYIRYKTKANFINGLDAYWANIKVSSSSSTSTSPTFNTAYTSNWFRSTGATGWYSESYGGGIYMTDSTYVRVFNNKAFYVSNSTYYAINTAGGFYGKLYSLNTERYILKPWGADYRTTSGTHTGAICITLPASIGNTMVSLWIDVYNYVSHTSFSVHVGGYTYSNSTWANSPSVMVYGANHTVRLGHNGTSFVIYIGETNSTWSYPQVSVRDIVLGYSPSYSNWANQWSVSFVTSFSNVTATITNYAWTSRNQTGLFTSFGNSGNNITATIGGTTKTFTVNYASNAGNADTVDGYHASSFMTIWGGGAWNFNIADNTKTSGVYYVHSAWTQSNVPFTYGVLADFNTDAGHLQIAGGQNNDIKARSYWWTYNNGNPSSFTYTSWVTLLTSANWSSYISVGSNLYQSHNGTTSNLYPMGSSTAGSGNRSTLYTRGEFYFNNTGAYHTSDVRKKYDIRDIYNKDVIDLFNTENAFIRFFRWKEDNQAAYGFIAQELQEYCPEAVDFNNDTGFYSVNYNVAFSKIVGAMFKKIKELEKRLKEKENS